MRKFTGRISTDKVGSECEFEFEVEDDATEGEIEETAREHAFDLIEWSYSPVTEDAPTLTQKPAQHDWQPSTLGHGTLMCKKCFITDREAAALGTLNTCED